MLNSIEIAFNALKEEIEKELNHEYDSGYIALSVHDMLISQALKALENELDEWEDTVNEQ